MTTFPWVSYPATRGQLGLIKHYASLHPKKTHQIMEFNGVKKYSDFDWDKAHRTITAIQTWRKRHAEDLEKGDFDEEE